MSSPFISPFQTGASNNTSLSFSPECILEVFFILGVCSYEFKQCNPDRDGGVGPLLPIQGARRFTSASRDRRQELDTVCLQDTVLSQCQRRWTALCTQLHSASTAAEQYSSLHRSGTYIFKSIALRTYSNI